MARYQNIFTQVQLAHAPEMGMPLPAGDERRIAMTGVSYWMGKFGQAQIGPIYLILRPMISIARKPNSSEARPSQPR